MQKSLLFVVGLVVMAASLAAQTHDNTKEKPASSDLVLNVDTRVGTTVLTAGEYRVNGDRESVTFIRKSDKKAVVTVACAGKDMGQKADETLATTAKDAKGVVYLKSLVIHGSAVEHTFN